MNALLLLCALGLISGFMLMTRVPLCSPRFDSSDGADQKNSLPANSVAIVVPARNEEQNLPNLLPSIPALSAISEIVVVDDNSTDRTSAIAKEFHARVLNPGIPVIGFTGKTWACAVGAEHTTAPVLFFLDADTFFEREGCSNILGLFAKHPPSTVLSILPFAITKRPYEELSLFFNLLIAFGGGSFGVFQSPRLFGQSLIIPRTSYQAIGGYGAVSHHVLENFHMAKHLTDVGATSECFGGRGTLGMRMFPHGLLQLWQGWIKAFAAGAQSTDPRILAVSIVWLSSLALIALLIPLIPHDLRAIGLTLYAFAAAQLFYFARQIGTFRIITCLLFPIPLVFFFVLFAQSAFRRLTHRTTSWRGRNV